MSAKKKRARRRPVDEDTAVAEAHAYIERVSASGHAAVRRAVDRLRRELARKPASAARIAAAERSVVEAHQQSQSVGLLVTELRGALEIATAKVATIEAEAALQVLLAVSRHHERGLARGSTKSSAVRGSVRARAKVSIATQLVEAKHATAVVIADRNKMREELTRLEADSASGAAVAAWRRALAFQEATIEALKAGLRALRDAAENRR